MTANLGRRVATDRGSINKYEIARTTLTRLNDGGTPRSDPGAR